MAQASRLAQGSADSTLIRQLVGPGEEYVAQAIPSALIRSICRGHGAAAAKQAEAI